VALISWPNTWNWEISVATALREAFACDWSLPNALTMTYVCDWDVRSIKRKFQLRV